MAKKVVEQKCRCNSAIYPDISSESIWGDGTAESIILDVRRPFLSEHSVVLEKQSKSANKVASEPNVQYVADYDKLCSPWNIPSNPAVEQFDTDLAPQICTWELLKIEDMELVRDHMFDKEAIKAMFCK